MTKEITTALFTLAAPMEINKQSFVILKITGTRQRLLWITSFELGEQLPV